MNERRVLDATDISEIFLWAIERKGEVREYLSDTGEIILSLSSGEFPSVDFFLATDAIDGLAEKLRTHTAIDVSGNPEAFARMLAVVALIANSGGPKVSNPSIETQEIASLVCGICTEFAVECAIRFAHLHNHEVDARKIPHRETSIALLAKDDEALARIFEEALSIASNAEGRGRDVISADSQHGVEQDAETLLRDLENRVAGANPIPGLASKGVERGLSATNYWNLRSVAKFRGWSAEVVLMLIDEHMSSRNSAENAQAVIQYPENWHVDSNPIPRHASKGTGRELPAASYWNLRSVARFRGWSAEVVLMLIDEHLSPTLIPYLVHYSDSVSGPDWQRLYDWLFRTDGSVL